MNEAKEKARREISPSWQWRGTLVIYFMPEVGRLLRFKLELKDGIELIQSLLDRGSDATSACGFKLQARSQPKGASVFDPQCRPVEI
jgi:hypothetical protein